MKVTLTVTLRYKKKILDRDYEKTMDLPFLPPPGMTIFCESHDDPLDGVWVRVSVVDYWEHGCLVDAMCEDMPGKFPKDDEEMMLDSGFTPCLSV